MVTPGATAPGVFIRSRGVNAVYPIDTVCYNYMVDGVKEVGMFITGDKLRRKGACVDQAEIFEKEWPDGAEVNEANTQKAVELNLNLGWFAQNFLSAPAGKVYNEAAAAAGKVYNEATAAAGKVYNEAAAPAWKVYDEATAAALIKAVKIHEGTEG